MANPHPPTSAEDGRPAVPRVRLLEHLEAARPDIVVIAAPAGYGKTTLLEQWIARDPRPLVRLQFEDAATDDDPEHTTLRRRESLVEKLMVLDDLHEVTSRVALDEVKALTERLPDGSTLVLIGRSVPDVLLGMARARRHVVDLDLSRLAFDASETEAACRTMGLEPSSHAIAQLVHHTEGWPAAIQLAIEGALGASDPDRFLAEFAGDDRYFAELLHEAVLDRLTDEDRAFLIAVAPLERVCGQLADEVLDRTGSALLLERLERKTLLLVPLDRRRTWYRCHRMLHWLLRAEHLKAVGTPGSNDRLKQRESMWYEQHGDIDAAIECAALAHDSVRATELVLSNFSAATSRGKPLTVEAWLHALTEVRVPSNPSLEAVSALVRMGLGDPEGCLRSLRRAEFSLPEPYPTEGPFEQPASSVAALRAVLDTQTCREMRDDAHYARRHTESPVWLSIACLAEGAAAFMTGDLVVATDALRASAAHAETCSFTTLSLAYAHHALIAERNGQRVEALRLVRQARHVVADCGLEGAPQIFLVQLVSALLEFRAGRSLIASADLAAGRSNMARCVSLAPWAYLQGYIALADIDRLRGDPAGKLKWLDEADKLLERVPDATLVKDQIAGVRQMELPRHTLGAGALSTLTAAELKVLHYLPTHFSLAEIADQLFLSRHTVKSHVMSTYRKLGTSSRSETVALLKSAGVLSDPPAGSSARPPDAPL
jgi:LuxR family transcriptional regulator, maltose regulon positive regulatory protein